ncbi:MAG: hypothetical protein HN337_06135 [Deltaproteobacteria bacterium]|nr:hypothetical protein [Deltaproteobacteria bacterium]
MKSRVSKKIFPLIVLVLAVTLFGLQLNRHIDDPIRADEAAWIFSSVYLDHYMAGEWNHPDWNHMDAIDHPPVVKYYYGLAVKSAGELWKTTDDKDWWFRSSQKISPMTFQSGMEERISWPVLRSCRIAVALAAVLASLALYFLGSAVWKPSFGLASSIFFLSSQLVLYFVPIVEPDFLLIAVTLLQAVFLVRWMKGFGWWDALMAAILVGIAIDTKLSGLIQVPVSVLAISVVIFQRRFDRRSILQSSVIVVIGFVVMILLNPTLHSPVDGLVKMVEHRYMQAVAVSQLSGLANIPIVDSIIVAAKYLFVDFGLIVDRVWLPFGFILSLIGGVYLVYNLISAKGRSGSVLCVIFMALLWGLLSFYSFSKTLWLRYLLPTSPYLAMVMGCAVLKLLSRDKRPPISV